MAKKKPKVRFFVRASGQEAQLFSAQQLRNGDIILGHKPNKFLDIPGFPKTEILSQKQTIHVSPRSDGHLVTSAIHLSTGDYIRYATFYSCDGGPLVAVIAVRRWPSLRYPLFQLKANDSDDCISVCEYDDLYNNLITSCVISSRGLGKDIIERYGGVFQSFEKFDISIIPKFVNFPSSSAGDLITPISSDPEINGDLGHGQFCGIPSLSLAELDQELKYFESAIISKFESNLLNIAKRNGIDEKMMISNFNRFSLGELADKPFENIPQALQI